MVNKTMDKWGTTEFLLIIYKKSCDEEMQKSASSPIISLSQSSSSEPKNTEN